MRQFRSRHWLYQAGFVCLLLATVCLLLGLLCPGWIQHTAAGVTRYGGLFLTCRDGIKRCQRIDLERYPEKLRTTQCLAILGMTCFGLASVFAVLDNFRPAKKLSSASAKSQSLIPEILTLAGAVSTFISVMVYIGEYDVIVKSPDVSYGYSMILSLLSSILAVVAAILIFIGNRKTPSGGREVQVHPNKDSFQNEAGVEGQVAPKNGLLETSGRQPPLTARSVHADV